MISATTITDTLFDPINPNDVVYRIAGERAEREAAFRLVYNSYLHAGLGEANRNAMRVTPYHLLESTQVFIAVHRRRGFVHPEFGAGR